MKNKIFLLFTIFFFISCSTTTNIEQNSNPLTIENKTPKEKLQFEDWKYKGFGNKLPQWSIYAYNNDIESLTTYIDNLTDAKEIKIFKAFGINHDQAEMIVKSNIENSQVLENQFNYYDSFWFKLSDEELSATQDENLINKRMNYVSLYLYWR